MASGAVLSGSVRSVQLCRLILTLMLESTATTRFLQEFVAVAAFYISNCYEGNIVKCLSDGKIVDQTWGFCPPLSSETSVRRNQA